MKNLYQSQIFLLAFVVMTMLFTAPNFSQSQTAMNMKAYSDFKKADTELNGVYQKMLKSYSSETTFIKKFRNAQRSGSRFVMQNWPLNTPDGGTYGSGHPCANRYI
ncbi:MAG: DUF1311 domain-containing protein [Pedobacter sp.]|nr:MAG: DUF1311 domain-containing protein [Pedobacter sp.]